MMLRRRFLLCRVVVDINREEEIMSLWDAFSSLSDAIAWMT